MKGSFVLWLKLYFSRISVIIGEPVYYNLCHLVFAWLALSSFSTFQLESELGDIDPMETVEIILEALTDSQ